LAVLVTPGEHLELPLAQQGGLLVPMIQISVEVVHGAKSHLGINMEAKPVEWHDDIMM